MGTKNNPGKFDCYTKAEPDEPMFILLGRDWFASGLVKLWAQLNNADPLGALDTFNTIIKCMPMLYETNSEKIDEAENCADTMIAWYEEKQNASE